MYGNLSESLGLVRVSILVEEVVESRAVLIPSTILKLWHYSCGGDGFFLVLLMIIDKPGSSSFPLLGVCVSFLTKAWVVYFLCN